MQNFIDKIEQYWAWVTASAVILTPIIVKFKSILSIVKKGWSWVKCIVNGAQVVLKRLDEQEKILNDIKNKIEKELSPNGGGSVVDAIRRIEEKFTSRDALDSAILLDYPFGIFQCDEEGRNHYVNRTYARMLGADRAELEGNGWKNFLSSDERERYGEVWSTAFKENREFEDSVEFTRPNKEKVRVIIHTYLLRSPTGKTLGFLGRVSSSPLT